MIRYSLLFLSIMGIALMACGDGKIPTATEPLVQLQAKYVTGRPVVDGAIDDLVWQGSQPYIIHIEKEDQSFNIIFRAIWWKEWAKGKSAWEEKAFLALSATWPDDDKNIDKNSWKYDPSARQWQNTHENSDWLVLWWWSLAEYSDLWYWDAAITNPMGYAEDQSLQTTQISNTSSKSVIWIDGLNFNNDTAEEQNTWDLNYDDNLTPRDSSDDKPKWAWTVNTPALPRVSSDETERMHFLLSGDVDFLRNTPYASPISAVAIPGYKLEEPKDQPADIMAAANWSNGAWTIELVRAAATTQANDVAFTPDDRWFSQYFYVTVGDNEKSPLDIGADSFYWYLNGTELSFEFVATEN